LKEGVVRNLTTPSLLLRFHLVDRAGTTAKSCY
jgi:hypothetical protein